MVPSHYGQALAAEFDTRSLSLMAPGIVDRGWLSCTKEKRKRRNQRRWCHGGAWIRVGRWVHLTGGYLVRTW